jgi:hypothetical protein
MKKAIILICGLVAAYTTFAQLAPATRSDVFPPSPNASSLGKYGDIPVGLFTGVPQVSIPMFSIKTKRLGVSVGLSYHAGGIKLEDRSSSVGMGWSLMAGGTISRSMRGRPDETSSGGFINGTPLNQIKTDPVLAYQAVNGVIDTQPDLFYFNFGGYSGKFFFDQAGKIYSNIANKFVIKPPFGQNASAGGGWSIITEDGTEYIFDVTETETVTSFCASGPGIPFPTSPIPTYISAWQLTKIISPDRTDEITFEYTTGGMPVVYKGFGSETKYIADASSPITGVPKSFCENEVRVTAVDLIKINFANGYLHFNYGIAPRTDIPNARTLKRVGLYNTQNQQLREFVLEHDYFSYQANFTKLKLLSVKEQKSDFLPSTSLIQQNIAVIEAQPPFLLDYYELYNPTIQTNGVRYAQDHWGYYNGIDNAGKGYTTMIPERVIEYSNNTNALIEGADKSPILEGSQTFALKSVTYPTGGYTGFEYELHDCIEPDLPYSKKKNAVQYSMSNLNPTSTAFDIKSYDISGKTLATIFLSTPNCTPDGAATVCNSTALNPGCPTIRIQKCNGGNGGIGLLGSCSNWVNIGTTYVGYYPNTYCKVTLPDGKYRLQGSGSGNYTASISYFEKDVMIVNGVASPNKKVGGLRISRMISNTAPTDPKPIIKKYVYKTVDGNSSGKLLSVPLYSYKTVVFESKTVAGTQITNSGYIPYISLGSYSNVALGTASGSYVCYTDVTVLNGDNGENGQENYKFSFYPDMVSNTFPFGPSTTFDYLRGLQEQNTIYKNDVVMKPVEMTTNIYNTTAFAPISVNGLKVGFKVEGIGGSSLISNYAFSEFQERTNWLFLANVKKRIYDSNSANYVETEGSFDYSISHYQLKTQTRTNSDGIKYITSLKYPLDYPNAGVLANMRSRNMQNAIVEKFDKMQKGTDAEQLLQATLNTYILDNNNKIVLSKVSQTELSKPDNNIIAPSYIDQQFFSYDAVTGNLLQVTTKGNDNTSFIWGYGDMLPIAEIKNATKTQVDVALSVASLTPATANALTDETTIRAKMQTVRQQLSQSLVTSNTYQPHIGTTSTTNPTSLSVYYTFDNFGRLKEIKNDKLEVVKSYRYNTRGQ